MSVIDSNDNVGSVDLSKVGGVQTKPKGSGERSRYVDYRCDYHLAFQQIAFVDADTGEFQEKRLTHRERRKKGDLAGIEKSLTALKCLDRIWQLANFRL